MAQSPLAATYDHTHWRTRDPVRSPIDKPVRARLVVGSVTTSESLVLYVFMFFLPHFCPGCPADNKRNGFPEPIGFPLKEQGQVDDGMDLVYPFPHLGRSDEWARVTPGLNNEVVQTPHLL